MNKPINILDKDYLQWVKELCKRYRQNKWPDKGCGESQYRNAQILLEFG